MDGQSAHEREQKFDRTIRHGADHILCFVGLSVERGHVEEFDFRPDAKGGGIVEGDDSVGFGLTDDDFVQMIFYLFLYFQRQRPKRVRKSISESNHTRFPANSLVRIANNGVDRRSVTSTFDRAWRMTHDWTFHDFSLTMIRCSTYSGINVDRVFFVYTN